MVDSMALIRAGDRLPTTSAVDNVYLLITPLASSGYNGPLAGYLGRSIPPRFVPDCCQHWAICVRGKCYEVTAQRSRHGKVFLKRAFPIEAWKQKQYDAGLSWERRKVGITRSTDEQIHEEAELIWKQRFETKYKLDRQNCQNFAYCLKERITVLDEDVSIRERMAWKKMPEVSTEVQRTVVKVLLVAGGVAAVVVVGMAIANSRNSTSLPTTTDGKPSGKTLTAPKTPKPKASSPARSSYSSPSSDYSSQSSTSSKPATQWEPRTPSRPRLPRLTLDQIWLKKRGRDVDKALARALRRGTSIQLTCAYGAAGHWEIVPDDIRDFDVQQPELEEERILRYLGIGRSHNVRSLIHPTELQTLTEYHEYGSYWMQLRDVENQDQANMPESVDEAEKHILYGRRWSELADIEAGAGLDASEVDAWNEADHDEQEDANDDDSVDASPVQLLLNDEPYDPLTAEALAAFNARGNNKAPSLFSDSDTLIGTQVPGEEKDCALWDALFDAESNIGTPEFGPRTAALEEPLPDDRCTLGSLRYVVEAGGL